MCSGLLLGDSRLADQLIGLPKERSGLTSPEKVFFEHQDLAQISTGSWLGRLGCLLSPPDELQASWSGRRCLARIHSHASPSISPSSCVSYPILLLLTQSSRPKPSCQGGAQTTAGEPAARLLIYPSSSQHLLTSLFSSSNSLPLLCLLLPLIPICSPTLMPSFCVLHSIPVISSLHPNLSRSCALVIHLLMPPSSLPVVASGKNWTKGPVCTPPGRRSVGKDELPWEHSSMER